MRISPLLYFVLSMVLGATLWFVIQSWVFLPVYILALVLFMVFGVSSYLDGYKDGADDERSLAGSQN